MDTIMQDPFLLAGAVCFLAIPLFYIGLTIRNVRLLRRETNKVVPAPTDAPATVPHPATQ